MKTKVRFIVNPVVPPPVSNPPIIKSESYLPKNNSRKKINTDFYLGVFTGIACCFFINTIADLVLKIIMVLNK